MISIISVTNRSGSNTLKVSNIYYKLLQKKDNESQLFSLEEQGQFINESNVELIKSQIKGFLKF